MALGILGATFDPGPRAIDEIGVPPIDLNSSHLIAIMARVKGQTVTNALSPRMAPWINSTDAAIMRRNRILRAIRNSAVGLVRVGLAGDETGGGCGFFSGFVGAVGADGADVPASQGTETANVVDQILADAAKLGVPYWWNLPGLDFAAPPQDMNEFGYLFSSAMGDPAGYLRMLADVQREGTRGGKYILGSKIDSFNHFVTADGFNFYNYNWLQNAWNWAWGLDKYTPRLRGVATAPTNVGVAYIKGKQAVAAAEAAAAAKQQNLTPPQTKLVVEAAKQDAAAAAGPKAQAYTGVVGTESIKKSTVNAVKNVEDAKRVLNTLKAIKAPADSVAAIVAVLPKAIDEGAKGVTSTFKWLPWIIGGALVAAAATAAYTLSQKAPDLSHIAGA